MKLKKRKLYKLIEIGTKTAAGFLPGPISAAFNALYDSVKESVLNKRAEKWKVDVILRLEKLEADFESLISNPTFATALIKTSELAVKTESDEKRQLLANALFNTYSNDIKEDELIIFLHLVDKYTCTHIKVLKYFCDDYEADHSLDSFKPTIIVKIKMHFIDLDDSYLKKIINDLQNDYLVERFNENAPALLFGKSMSLVTKLGIEFYNFIKDTQN